MITTAVLDQVRERVSAGSSPEESCDALGRRYRLDSEEQSALWFTGRLHASDPDRIARRERERSILTPID